ncbi:MAG: hypothetical protein MUE44_32470 [Oscillatoriaceae cyanobacterium Prado104]|nr:hypothetical protein [Oscillatoriaceae cyanobacterium Prado104]
MGKLDRDRGRSHCWLLPAFRINDRAGTGAPPLQFSTIGRARGHRPYNFQLIND